MIVAEGDSWFEFLFFIKDIIDHLSESYKIYSLAYGGDWLTNIVYEGRYVEKLSVFNPDVFLVSGGGNDLVGSDRLGIMVTAKDTCKPAYEDRTKILGCVKELYPEADNTLTQKDLDDFLAAQKHIQPAFYSFIHIMKLQYMLVFNGIHRKYPEMKIITQAYDYAIPSPKFHGFFISVHRFVNRLLGTGKWLYLPLMINGITDPILQRQLIRFMIFQFNLMFAEIALSNKNVFHIDCRGVAQQDSDWYDELHLKSRKFKVISNAYTECIESNEPSKKIYFASQYSDRQK